MSNRVPSMFGSREPLGERAVALTRTEAREPGVWPPLGRGMSIGAMVRSGLAFDRAADSGPTIGGLWQRDHSGPKTDIRSRKYFEDRGVGLGGAQIEHAVNPESHRSRSGNPRVRRDDGSNIPASGGAERSPDWNVTVRDWGLLFTASELDDVLTVDELVALTRGKMAQIPTSPVGWAPAKSDLNTMASALEWWHSLGDHRPSGFIMWNDGIGWRGEWVDRGLEVPIPRWDTRIATLEPIFPGYTMEPWTFVVEPVDFPERPEDGSSGAHLGGFGRISFGRKGSGSDEEEGGWEGEGPPGAGSRHWDPDLGTFVWTDDEDDDDEDETLAGSDIIYESEPRNYLGAEVPDDVTLIAFAYRLRFATWWDYP